MSKVQQYSLHSPPIPSIAVPSSNHGSSHEPSLSRRDNDIVNPPSNPDNVRRHKRSLKGRAAPSRSESSAQRCPNDGWAFPITELTRANYGIVHIEGQVSLLSRDIVRVSHVEFSGKFVLLAGAESDGLRQIELEVGRGRLIAHSEGVRRVVAWSLDAEAFVLGVFGVRRYDGSHDPWSESAFEAAVLDDRGRDGAGSTWLHCSCDGDSGGVDRCWCRLSRQDAGACTAQARCWVRRCS